MWRRAANRPNSTGLELAKVVSLFFLRIPRHLPPVFLLYFLKADEWRAFARTDQTPTKERTVMKSVSTMLKTSVVTLTLLGLMTASPDSTAGASGRGVKKQKLTMSAGTVFNLNAYDANGNPLPFPWKHQVRGIAQVSSLGNCKVFFDVSINPGSECSGGHAFCLSGTLTVTTLAGDKLIAELAGWADPDPKDPKGAMYLLHYDVGFTDGTGKLEGARGVGDIKGIFMFAGPDPAPAVDTDPTDDVFCDGYAGTATWQFEGVLILPKK
jgi:hypothetical protein